MDSGGHLHEWPSSHYYQVTRRVLRDTARKTGFLTIRVFRRRANLSRGLIGIISQTGNKSRSSIRTARFVRVLLIEEDFILKKTHTRARARA